MKIERVDDGINKTFLMRTTKYPFSITKKDCNIKYQCNEIEKILDMIITK
jgi:hypothetical protein